MHLERLFCLPGSGHMGDDPAAVYESWATDGVDRSKPLTIEEWDVHPPSFHLPSADSTAEWAAEWAEDNEWDDDGRALWHEASGSPDVVAAFQAALDLLASKIGWRMADKLIATHAVTWDADGNPRYDGEPMYRPALSNRVT
jgi:hypothetical protein